MTGTAVTTNRQVLPTNVTPLHYDLKLEPDFQTFQFGGHLKLDLQVNDSELDSIFLNSQEIEFHSVSLEGQEPVEIKYDGENQVTEFKFTRGALADKQKVTLDIKYTGELNDQLAGFYRAKYEDKLTGETKYMASTQMEPTAARRAFPCYDEPNRKATFDITLVSESHLTHLSNMDVKLETVEAGKKVTHFNTTPKMSTYLVAFIVAELKYVENKDFRIPVRCYATPGNEHLGQFAADLTSKTLAFFEETFGLRYPLPKMDNVAVHEVSAGAMENWGLVIYRVVDVLLDKENSTLSRIRTVAEMVQHELAHQWFGNVVTMDWWEGLWLNEGFATWMACFSSNEFQPDWKVWEDYVANTLQEALDLDSLRSSHPIEVTVRRADEISQIFDAIAYSKGSSVLRMISKWLGEKTFIKGVSQYLQKFLYGNAQTSDLWASLSEVSGKDVRKVMDIWTKKVGYPVISVQEDGNKITFTQNRYLSTGDLKPEEDETLYPVFLALATREGVDNSLVLDERSKTIELKDTNFFKVNAAQAGIFITSYSDERWAKFGHQAHLLPVGDRVGLVADSKALSASGYTCTTNFLNLVSQWDKEESFIVWEQIIKSLSALQSTWIFEPQETKDALDNFIKKLVSPKAHTLGWSFSPTDSFAIQRLKVAMFGAASAAGDAIVEKAALEMFAKYTCGDKKAIPALIKPTVFNAVARAGGIDNYEKLFHIYKNPLSSDEKLASLEALGHFEDLKLLERTLSYLTDGNVLYQDMWIPMQGMTSHKNGIQTLWAWLQDNWDDMSKRLPPGFSLLGSLMFISTSAFTSMESRDQVKKFFSGRSTKGFNQNLAQSLDIISCKAKWVNRDREVVKKYLVEHGFF